jgi:N6-adenosine-specific RNA methylase IME4
LMRSLGARGVGLYRTIVADPPWDHSDGTGRNYGERDHRGTGRGVDHHTGLPYGVMGLPELMDLPVDKWAAPAAHLYLWTTNRYLRDSWRVAEAWGFSVRVTLVWQKQPMGFFGKPFPGNTTEFCQYAVRGALAPIGSVTGRCFEWPRGKHSAKPEAFLDLVEQVSPGPYLELFARRARFGWDYWGDESLQTVELAS